MQWKRKMLGRKFFKRKLHTKRQGTNVIDGHVGKVWEDRKAESSVDGVITSRSSHHNLGGGKKKRGRGREFRKKKETGDAD